MTYATRAVHLEMTGRIRCNGQPLRGTMATSKIASEVTCRSCLRAITASKLHEAHRQKFTGGGW